MDINRINLLVFILTLVALGFAFWGFLHKDQGTVAIAPILVSVASIVVAWSVYLDSKSQREIEAFRRRAVLSEDVEARYHGQSGMNWGLTLKLKNTGLNLADSISLTSFMANSDFGLQVEASRSHSNPLAPNGVILFNTPVMDFSGSPPSTKYVGIAIEYVDPILEKRFKQFIAVKFDTSLTDPWKSPMVCSIEERAKFLNALKTLNKFNIADSK